MLPVQIGKSMIPVMKNLEILVKKNSLKLIEDACLQKSKRNKRIRRINSLHL
jgi:hypothetical protein